MANLNNDDIRCGLFKEVKVNCNYIRQLYEEFKGKKFEVDEEYEEQFWYEYNGIVSCRSVNDKRYEEHIIDDLEIHIDNSDKWVTETNIDEDSDSDECSDSDEEFACCSCDKPMKDPSKACIFCGYDEE